MRKFYLFSISLFFVCFSIKAQDNLSITKTITTIPLKPGDAIVYQINYSNLNSTGTANSIVIKDFLPTTDLFTYVSSTSGSVYDASTRIITWSGLNLAAGTSGSLTISGICGKLSGPTGLYDAASYYISNGSSTQSIINNASIQNPTISNPIYINTPVNTSVQQYCGSSLPSGLIGYIKSATNSEIYYLVTLTNTGNITDKYTLSSNNPGTKISIPSFIETITGTTLTQTPYITPGNTYSFKVRFKTPTGTSPDTVNNTIVTATSFVCGTTATANIITYVYGGQIPSGTACDLQITKTASANPALAGTNFVYTITVVNGAVTHDASNVLIIDYLPANVSIVSYTGSSGTTITNPSTNQIRASKNTQKNSDAPIVLTITVTPTCAAVPSITNYAVVSTSTPDSVASNDEIYVATNVNSTIASPTVNSTTICSGATASLTASGSVSNPGYKWYSALAAGSALYTGNPYTTPGLTATTTYYVSVYDLSNPACESNRTPVTVTVLSAPVITSQPSNTAICPGNNTNFSIVSSGTSLSYQWQVNKGGSFTNLTNAAPYSGALSATLTIATATTGMNSYQYRCLVQTGTCTPPVNSTPATLTINSPPAITAQPSSSTTCSGQSQTFTVTATGTAVTYQWRKGGVNISGATSSTYNITSVATGDAGSYGVMISGTCSPPVTSSPVSLTVNSLPAIISQPASATKCVGQSQTFSVAATGTSLTYQWRKGGINIGSATSANYAIASVNTGDAGSYDVVVNGTCASAVISSAVTLGINTMAAITVQPLSVVLCSGQSQTFTVTATGTSLAYQWRKGGVSIPGATSSGYNIASITSADAGTYDVVINGFCPPYITSTSATLTVNTAPTITTHPVSQTVCSGTPVDFSVSVLAGSGTGITYQWEKNGTKITGATSSSYSISTPTMVDAGSYTVAVTSCGTTIISSIATLSISSTGTWLGVTTDWNDFQNWCGGAVPDSATDVIIPVTGSNLFPIISSISYSRNITIASGASLVVNNAILQIAGTIISSGTFNASNGTVEMNGSVTQTIPANTFVNNSLKNLIVSNTSAGGVTLGGALDLYGTLSFGAVDSKIFSSGGYLTLKSTASGTATVADLTNNDANSGNQVLGDVNVERYLSSVKKWRFLTVSTNSTQTIKAAWQEGCGTNLNCLVNYGTQITGAGGVPAGFDVYTATPSMKSYNTAGNVWVGVPTTNATLINNISNNTIAYMVFVRGDRTATTFTSPVTSTVLRTRGVIKQNDQAAITIASPATAFTAVGNPYPSRIDLRKMIPAPTTATKIYVWDPLATIGSAYGLGAYQTLTFDGDDFTVTPGGGSYGGPYNQNPNYIESGSAFLVGGNASPYDITFRETIKPSIGNLISSPARLKENFRANLFINNNGVTSLMDGTKAEIGTKFSSDVDDNDAYKFFNSSENVSLKRNGKLLGVERYNMITELDTFYLNLINLRVQNYQWQLNMQNMDQPGLSGFLLDSYKKTSIPLVLNGSNIVDFNIENIPGSYAADRFTIVFTQAKVLPSTFTTVKAYLQKTDIKVEWNVENESNIRQYEVEKSTDANTYSTVNITPAKNTPASLYSWIDADAKPGNNYYRIKSVDLNGKMEYSKVVKVFVSLPKQLITIYPNPIKDCIINLQMVNQAAGAYGIRLLNTQGQTVLGSTLQHAGGTSTEKITLEKRVVRGIYTLEVMMPNDKVISNRLIY